MNKNLIFKIDQKIYELSEEINNFSNHILFIWENIITDYQTNYINGAYIITNLNFYDFHKFMSRYSSGLKLMHKTMNELIEEKNKIIYFLDKENFSIWDNYEDEEIIETCSDIANLLSNSKELYICD
jgi:hypothetical protein